MPTETTTAEAKDAPRCLKCGMALPAHARGCPLAPDEPRDALPGKDARDAYEVTP